MDKRQEKLQKRLNELQEKLNGLNEKKLSPGVLRNRMRELSQEKTSIENELLDLLIESGEPYQADVWGGVKQGMLVALKSLEKSLKRSLRREPVHSEGKLTRTIRKLCENPIAAWCVTVLLVYLLLIAVGCLGSGFKMAFGGADGARQLFAFATNPFMGLIVGMLATALIQSSSTSTSIIVALCAAGMPVSTAIPMVMGANVGTTVTNTLVSLGHIGSKREFKRAFSAATVHDFFNLLAIAIFLPLEILLHPLERISGALAQSFYGAGGMDLSKANFMKPLLKPAEKFLAGLFQGIPGPGWIGTALFILFGLILIFATILLLGKLLRQMMTGRAEAIFHMAVGRSPMTAILSGLVITVLVQSSSTTTSLVVPLAGAGVMTLPQVYPFTLGANIGTCITALLAAMAITGSGAAMALQIALVHMLFNTFGVAVIYGLKFLRWIPMWCAIHLAHMAARRKLLALGYIGGVFFILPLLCLGIYRLFE